MLQQSRDNLLKLYKKSKFPQEIINQDCFPHYHIIFNQDSIEHQLKINQIQIKEDFFIIETDNRKSKFLKEPYNNLNWRSQKNNLGVKYKEKKNPDSFQKINEKNPKFNSNHNENKIDSKFNTDDQQQKIKEELQNDIIQKHLHPISETNVILSNVLPTNIGINQNPILNYQNPILQQFLPNLFVQGEPNLDSNFDIKVLQKYNSKLNYPENLPLWYLFHSILKTSFGPFTTLQIENMFNLKQIFSYSLIRFIEIYERKDSDQFNFFQLKDLENQNMLNEIIPSKILKYINIENFNLLEKKHVNVGNDDNIIVGIQEQTNKKQELKEEIKQQQNNSKKTQKKGKYRPIKESDFHENKNNNPNITTHNNDTNSNSTVIANNEFKEMNKLEKDDKLIHNNNLSFNSDTFKINTLHQNKLPSNNAENFETKKLDDILYQNQKNKVEPNSEKIDNISQQNKITIVGNKKGKKGAKPKFTDLNIEIGI